MFHKLLSSKTESTHAHERQTYLVQLRVAAVSTVFLFSNTTSIKENEENETFVFQVKATDADSGNNSVITYTLLPGEYEGKFSIGKSSGNITVSGGLDRENISQVILGIQATDGKFSTTTKLVINLEDVNDNAPYFTKSLYSASVPETIPIGHLIINVTAQDKDSGSNGRLTYSLVQGPNDTETFVNETFSINASNGAITSLKKIELDAPQIQYKFQVKAIDNGNPILQSFANVEIMFEDVNNNPPIFISR